MNSNFLFNTRGPKNTGNNCFLNSIIISMFGYRKSPFHFLKKFPNRESEIIYKCFQKIVYHIERDEYPDITVMRNALPDYMKFGQQDCSETFDNFMKILNFEPMKIRKVRESRNDNINSIKDIFKGNDIIQQLSYLTLDNNGNDNINPIKDIFFPSSWEDMGCDPSNWIQDENDKPKYRYTRERITEMSGDCLIFHINRGINGIQRHTNIIKTPNTIENEDNKYFLFAIILHLSNGINYGHYVVVLSDGSNFYLYDDSNKSKIINNVIDMEKHSEYIERNSVMFFYYKL